MNIIVEKLTKTYETAAEKLAVLQDVHFSMKSGEWLTVIGPSGSGKSSLLQCIVGIVPPDKGSIIRLDDLHLHEASVEAVLEFRRKRVGFIYQDYKLFNQFDALTNVILPLAPYERKDILYKRGKALLEKVHLAERIHHMPSQLSGGEKQRVAIARALINYPELLICDEPTGNLDEENRDHIIEILHDLNKEGKSILLVTHDKEVISQGQRLMQLQRGKVYEQEKKRFHPLDK
ncbi:putative ABC transport system ATP-binding protein [Evansella caseinilytica]|uniref:Putative ABC transport system ATP-binding protein n=1 Tax=Evansella caseinilytica TaxID=1503961 RepID=A0A1H3V0H2_9BACI|nr:ABC transporter ATP-binding protein [Evansella caseinilytica]SDZ68162.1 putative ABC transport system ATP-binding protein [Evansella caseinilytica]